MVYDDEISSAILNSRKLSRHALQRLQLIINPPSKPNSGCDATVVQHDVKLCDSPGTQFTPTHPI